MNIDKRNAMIKAEKNGLVADSRAVRIRLMERVRAGELTLEESQIELKRIQNEASLKCLKTRAEVCNEN